MELPVRLTIHVLDVTILDITFDRHGRDHPDETIREAPFGFGGGTTLYAERPYPEEEHEE